MTANASAKIENLEFHCIEPPPEEAIVVSALTNGQALPGLHHLLREIRRIHCSGSYPHRRTICELGREGRRMHSKGTRSSLIHANPTHSNETREFIDGSRRSVVTLESARVGIGTYQSGWRWSLHAGPQTGKPSEGHIGYILSGCMAVRDSTGKVEELGPGEAFEVGPDHDAWVVGDESCIALDFSMMKLGR